MATEKQAIFFDRITNLVIDDMEKCQANDWQQSWINVGQFPTSVDGYRYQGGNVLTCWLTAALRDFDHQVWGTYRQWKTAGYPVPKGEKASSYLLAPLVAKRTDDKTGDDVFFTTGFKSFAIWNADQVNYEPDLEPLPAIAERIEKAERFVSNTNATINYGGDRAYFRPSTDSIQMPVIEAFADTEAFYATFMHELTHWTGHEKRLNRIMKRHGWDKQAYAAEELVAELGAAYACSYLGISHTPRKDHAQYLKSWLTVLRGDNQAIFTAASAAQKALDHLLEYQQEAKQAA